MKELKKHEADMNKRGESKRKNLYLYIMDLCNGMKPPLKWHKIIHELVVARREAPNIADHAKTPALHWSSHPSR